jgi:predicted O-linked N-acetylglucosamine transferase (SPINDLY family)
MLVGLALTRLWTAEWHDHTPLIRKIKQAMQKGRVPGTPAKGHALVDDPAIHYKCSRHYSSHYSGPSLTRLFPQASPHKLRVAYISGDFRVHPVSLLAAGLFEHHDRNRFELFAFAWDCDDSDLRRRIQAAFDQFVDISDASDERAAELIRDADIDIAVDLKGFTRGHRAPILAGRPAKIQVNYLGYPGTLAADWIDYIVADRFVVPPESGCHYSEKLVYMPDSFMVNDSMRPIPGVMPARESLGLPPVGFVFACFNNPYKILPDLFDIWMRLLKRVPGSVLWLHLMIDDRLWTQLQTNFRREAATRGVDGERIVFASYTRSYADHINRLQCADLFLDTLPFNAHTTASDALWASVPLITCPGRSFPARVAGSLLRAIEMPELITSSLAEYEAKALELAKNSSLYTAIRAKLRGNRSTAALFDTARFTRNLEAAYEAMWNRQSNGKAAQTIEVRVS